MPLSSLTRQRTAAEELLHALLGQNPDEVRYWLIAGASLVSRVSHGQRVQSVLNHWVTDGPIEHWSVLAAYARPVLDHVTHRGVCPLSAAVSVNRVSMVTLLLDAGAKIDGPDQDGRNPAMTAVRNGAIKALDLLIERGANMAVRTSEGNTLLHEAARRPPLNVVPRLLRAGVDPDALNDQGQTVEDVLQQEAQPEAFAGLQNEWRALLIQHTQSVLRQAMGDTLDGSGTMSLPEIHRPRL